MIDKLIEIGSCYGMEMNVEKNPKAGQNPPRVVAPTEEDSVALVRERTIPTERPPPVGEVSANFCG